MDEKEIKFADKCSVKLNANCRGSTYAHHPKPKSRDISNADFRRS